MSARHRIGTVQGNSGAKSGNRANHAGSTATNGPKAKGPSGEAGRGKVGLQAIRLVRPGTAEDKVLFIDDMATKLGRDGT